MAFRSRSDSQGIGLPQQVSGAGTNDYRSAALASQPDYSSFLPEQDLLFQTGLFEPEQDYFNPPSSDVGELDALLARGPHSDLPFIGGEVPLGTEEGGVPMDFGLSEVNVPEVDVFMDQFRRHENPGDLLSTTTATAAGSVVAAHQPQQLVQNDLHMFQLGGERELSTGTPVSDGPGPVQASTPGPLAQPMQQQQHNFENSVSFDDVAAAMDDYEQPQSVRSDISVVSSMADNPVQESVIWKEVNNSNVDGMAVQLHAGLHRLVEGSKQQLCHGVSTVRMVRFNHRAESLSLPAPVDMSKIRLTPDSIDVPFVLPGGCKPFLALLEEHRCEQDAGLCFMNMVFQYVRTVDKFHSQLKTGYGAFNDLQCLYVQEQSFRRMTRGKEPQVFLMPDINVLTTAASDLLNGLTEEEVGRAGRLRDIKALGAVLEQLLCRMEDLEIHASAKMVANVRKAIGKCEESVSGDRLADIARTLECTTKLCGLRVMIPGPGIQQIIDIACLEGEKISSVVNAWFKATEGKLLCDFGAILQNSNGVPYSINDDQEVCHPFSNVKIVSRMQ